MQTQTPETKRIVPKDFLEDPYLILATAITAAGIGFGCCATTGMVVGGVGVDYLRQQPIIQPVSGQNQEEETTPIALTAQPTPVKQPTRVKQPTPEPTAIPTQADNLYYYFARDIIEANPNLSLDKVARQLKTIAENIPSNTPFLAEAGLGLIPHPATGGVVRHEGPLYGNAPEGGFLYSSSGHSTHIVDGRAYVFPWQKNNVYLAFVIGKPNDGTPADLNTTVKTTDYKPGHIYVNQAAPTQSQDFPNRQVVDGAWLAQQLLLAAQNGSNCGVGCEYTITVAFIDAETGKEYLYQVNPDTFEWKKVTRDQLRSQEGQRKADAMAQLNGRRNPSRITRPPDLKRRYINVFPGTGRI